MFVIFVVDHMFIIILKYEDCYRFDLDGKSHWPPMLGDMLDQSPVVKILPENMNDKYAPKAWYECPTYFHNGEGVYPSYMQGAGYFLPWWAIACIYQQSFQVNILL